MKIGDIVRYRCRRYYLRGFTPLGVPERQAELEDMKTGERLTVPLDEIEPESHDRWTPGRS